MHDRQQRPGSGKATLTGPTLVQRSPEPGKRSLTDALPAAGGPKPQAAQPDRGGGQALPGEVKGKMEGAFGADFSSVRVHEDASAAAIGAQAYTQGANIHFAPGQYQPGSPAGQELLGHELAHVVQQGQGRVQATAQAKGLAVNDDAGLEQEADEMGAKASRGEPVSGAAADGGGPQLAGGAGAVQMLGGDTVKRIAAAIGVGLGVATAIYLALPEAVLLTLLGGGISALSEYWAGIVNGLVFGGGGSPQGEQDKQGEGTSKTSETSLENPSKETKKEKEQELESSEEEQSGLPGDCLYTAVNEARGNRGGNERAFRRIATSWLVQVPPNHVVFDYADQNELVDVVSEPQAWTGDAGDLSAVVLAHSLGIRLRIVTAGNVYVFDGGGDTVTIYYHGNHYTSQPVIGVHEKQGSEIVSAPKKKKPSRSEPKQDNEKEKEKESPRSPSITLELQKPSNKEVGSSSKPPSLSFEDEQWLRNILRSLGAEPNLTKKDRNVLDLIKQALSSDSISERDLLTITSHVGKPSSSSSYSRGSAPRKEEEDSSGSSISFDEVVTLDNGTQVDFPALTAVMNDVQIGTQVAPSVWRRMRQDLSAAITLSNKSHPAHGSNFNSPQRPEQQIKDWAKPLKGTQLYDLLVRYFKERYNIDL